MPPEFLVVGHIVQDLAPDQSGGGPAWRAGGTAIYAGLVAQRLGLRTAVLTAAAPDQRLDELFPGIEIACVQSQRSTQIRNVYTADGRVQYIPRRAAPIRPSSLPDDWRGAEVVLLGPVAGEVHASLAGCFPRALIGVSAQGWLRRIGADSRVRPRPPRLWRADSVLEPAHALFVSDEDVPLAASAAALKDWSGRVDVLAYTRGERGAEVCYRGTWRHIDAFPVDAVDPTGAGDVFAAAFLVRHRETGDPWQAARFAACAASFIVEAEGATSPPDRAMIEARLRAHPEIVAR